MNIDKNIDEIKTTSKYDFNKLINKVGFNNLHPYINIRDKTDRTILLWAFFNYNRENIVCRILDKYNKSIKNDYIYEHGSDLLMKLYYIYLGGSKKNYIKYCIYKFIEKCSHICNLNHNIIKILIEKNDFEFIVKIINTFGFLSIKPVYDALRSNKYIWPQYKFEFELLMQELVKVSGIMIKPYKLYGAYSKFQTLYDHLNSSYYFEKYVKNYGILYLSNKIKKTGFGGDNNNLIILIFGKY